MSNMYFLPFRPAYDGAGLTVPGSQHYFTVSDGGTGGEVPSAPFADAALTIRLSNPVVADGIGKLPPVYLDQAVEYRVRIYGRTAVAGVDTPLEEYAPYLPGTAGTEADAGLRSDLSAETGGDLVGYVAPAASAVARTLSDKLDELPVSAMDVNAKGDGATSDSAAFTALSSKSEQFIPAGNYTLATSVTWPDQDYHIRIDVGASFADTTKLKLGNVLKYHDDAQWVIDATRKAYGAAYANTWTVFQFAQRADATYTGVKAVAMYGQGIATVSGAKGWGMNCAGSAEVAGASAIGAEITALSNAAGTTTTALSLEGKGTNANTAALQITTGGVANGFSVGFNVSNASDRSSILASGTLFEAELTKCTNGFHLDGSIFTGAEYSSGNLLLGTADGTHTARPQLKGNVGEVGLLAKGYGGSAATVASVNVSTLGNAAINFYTGGEKTGQILKLDNSTATQKIGFFGAAPVAKQTATDIASLIAALRAYGLLV